MIKVWDLKPLVCLVSLVACVGTHSLAHGQSGPPSQRHSFSVVHLTENEAAHLNFTLGPPEKPVRADTVESVQVQLKFLDGTGTTILQPAPQFVVPGQSISLSLLGEDLGSSGGGMRAVVETLSPNARFLATLEIEDPAVAARFVLFRAPRFGVRVYGGLLGRPCLGPLTLKSDETARLTYTNETTVSLDPRTREIALEFFRDSFFSGTVLAQRLVVVPMHESASLDLSDVSGPIQGCIGYTASGGSVIGVWTLEIFRKDTGQRVALLSGYHPPDTGGNGGGGAGYSFD